MHSIRAGVVAFTVICFISYVTLLFGVYGISGKTRSFAIELQTMKNELVALESERALIAARFSDGGILAQTNLVEPNEKSMAYLYIDNQMPAVALR